MHIKDAVVAISGASSGIGLALARAFAEAGAKVVLAARRAERLRALADELETHGRKALAVPTDVRDRAQVERWIEAAFGTFGRLDMLVNNAARGAAAHVEATPIAHYRELFEVNVVGALQAMQAAIPGMRAQGGGLILNVSSGAGRLAIPGLSAYGASKAALDLVSNTARGELQRDNIRVVTLYPPNTESEAAQNMLGDPRVALPVLVAGIATVVRPERMRPVPAATVARQVLAAIAEEPLEPNLYLDADMFAA